MSDTRKSRAVAGMRIDVRGRHPHHRVVLGAALGAAWLVTAPAAHASSPMATSELASVEGGCEGTFTLLHPKPDACLEPIETDRPHRTDTPHALDGGHLQVELGIAELAMAGSSSAARATAGIFNNSYKIGLAENWGLLRGWDFEVLHQMGDYDVESGTMTWNPSLLLRTKLNFLGGPVAATLVPVLAVPLHAGERVEAGGFLFLGGELPAELEFELNVGGLTDSDPAGAGRAFAGVLTGAVTRHIAGPATTFLEFYNDRSFRDGEAWNASVDTGLLLQLHRDLQLDFGVYVGVRGDMPRVTPFLGLSGRL